MLRKVLLPMKDLLLCSCVCRCIFWKSHAHQLMNNVNKGRIWSHPETAGD